MGKVAAIQMCSTPNVEENLQAALQLIQQAAQAGAELIVLPEMFATLMANENDKILHKEPIGSGKIQTFLAEAARKTKTWLIGGTFPIACNQEKKVRAACLVFNNQGQLVARYDKIHLFDVDVTANEIYRESNTIEPGEDAVVIDTPVGRVGLAVCYDIRFPELFRLLFNRGAEIIALPAAFTARTGIAHWEILTRARAIENLSYFIGANQGGTHPTGRKTFGHSLIIGPWGNVLAEQKEDVPGVVLADINLQTLHELRKAMPVLAHQRFLVGG